MIAYLKAANWEYLLLMLLITVGPLLVIVVPILIIGAAPLEAWITVGVVTAAIVAMIFGMEWMSR